MATIRATIFKPKALKDGKHKIRVAVSQKGETCYIVTNLIIDSLSQFKNGQVTGRPDAPAINVKLRNILNKYQETLDGIKNINNYDCRQIRDILINNRDYSGKTFQEVSKEYISELVKDERFSYAKLMEANCKYFTTFSKGDFLMADFTPQIIDNYDRYLRARRLSETTIGMFMSRTKVIINYSKRNQYVKYDIEPFAFYKISRAPERELDISVEEFLKIRDSKPKLRKYIVARDVFCLSYYLGGINLVDLLKIDFRGKKYIEYIRTKSRNMKQGEKRISMTIQPEAKTIINRWMDEDTGKLNFGYKFNYHCFSIYMTRNIGLLAKSLGIERRVVYYSARKSFVQHGFELGISLPVLEYCIGQSMKTDRPIYNYIRIMRRHADEATRKILDNLNTQKK
jgi:integrase